MNKNWKKDEGEQFLEARREISGRWAAVCGDQFTREGRSLKFETLKEETWHVYGVLFVIYFF